MGFFKIPSAKNRSQAEKIAKRLKPKGKVITKISKDRIGVYTVQTRLKK